MTYIGLTRDDLTPDEVVDPMDCEAVREMVDEWVHQITVEKTDATLPDGNVVIEFESACEHIGNWMTMRDGEELRELGELALGDINCIARSAINIVKGICVREAYKATAYLKSLNDTEQD